MCLKYSWCTTGSRMLYCRTSGTSVSSATLWPIKANASPITWPPYTNREPGILHNWLRPLKKKYRGIYKMVLANKKRQKKNIITITNVRLDLAFHTIFGGLCCASIKASQQYLSSSNEVSGSAWSQIIELPAVRRTQPKVSKANISLTTHVELPQ